MKRVAATALLAMGLLHGAAAVSQDGKARGESAPDTTADRAGRCGSGAGRGGSPAARSGERIHRRDDRAGAMERFEPRLPQAGFLVSAGDEQRLCRRAGTAGQAPSGERRGLARRDVRAEHAPQRNRAPTDVRARIGSGDDAGAAGSGEPVAPGCAAHPRRERRAATLDRRRYELRFGRRLARERRARRSCARGFRRRLSSGVERLGPHILLSHRSALGARLPAAREPNKKR